MLRKNYTLHSPYYGKNQRLNRQLKAPQLTVDNEQKEIHSQRMKAGKKRRISRINMRYRVSK